MKKIDIESLAMFRDSEMEKWPLCKKNYEELTHCRRRPINIGPLSGAIQYNPARIVSTGAKVDRGSIAARPCFLCESNRPSEQTAVEIIEGWKLLVNPYPILPIHFTIASDQHTPQRQWPLEMITLAEMMPGMTIFFNGASAGASAPDHSHMQAVMGEELPLIRFLEDGGTPEHLPFMVDYYIITPDVFGLRMISEANRSGGGLERQDNPDFSLQNVFCWLGKDGLMRIAVIPRLSHRPECYTNGSGEGLMISPGAIDMAGLIITPRKTDFETVTTEDILRIFSEVAIPQP